MKRFLIPRTATHVLFLALILVACGALPAPTQQPTAAPPQPTQTPVIVVQTVIVEATQAATEVPPTPVPPTATAAVVVEPTQVPATNAPAEAAPTEASGGPIMVDDALGAGFFVSMTRDRNDLSLRCQANQEITFSVMPNTTDITQVDFYYRIEDRTTGSVFDWQNAGRMIQDASGNFVMVFSGDDVNQNFRKPNAWFDYQFIGSSGSGVVGRSEKIEKQVTYTFDCP